MSLCKYKTIFGEPAKGIHNIRIFNLAIVDVVGTIIVSYLIAKYYKFSVWYVMAISFLLGIILHRLFCVRTTIDKLLFPSY